MRVAVGRSVTTMFDRASGQVVALCVAVVLGLLVVLPVPGSTAGPAHGRLSAPRLGATVTALPDGRVLVVGGGKARNVVGRPRAIQASAEVIDPSGGTTTSAGTSTSKRAAHTATLLPDGRVLVVGGWNGSAAVAGADLWDPATGAFTRTGAMADARLGHTATLLTDGRVLIAGGATRLDGSGTMASAELYDPATGTFTPSGSMAATRSGAAAVRLADGRVLILGGSGRMETPWDILSERLSAEIWDPATGTFVPTGAPEGTVVGHTASLLPDGKVLLVGRGRYSGGTGGAYGLARYAATAEVWDAATGAWTPVEPIPAGITRHTATSLGDGSVVIAGGDIWSVDGLGTQDTPPVPAVARFDPGTGRFDALQPLREPRSAHAATALPDGRLLVAGGLGLGDRLLRTWEVVDPAAVAGSPGADSSPEPVASPSAAPVAGGTAYSAGAQRQPRWGQTATTLPDGRVLLVGGASGISRGGIPARVQRRAETWDPVSERFSPAGSLATPRISHTATLLADGRVLIAGGTQGRRAQASTETWDPLAGAFSPAVDLASPRLGHTATLLSDGRVLIVGGATSPTGKGTSATAEIVDPAAGTTTPTGSLAHARWGHAATLLPDGRVLVVGGSADGDGAREPRRQVRDAEVWDPADGTWSPAGAIEADSTGLSATALPDGRALVVGRGTVVGPKRSGNGRWGLTGLVWDPADRSFAPTAGQPRFGRARHTATALPDGRVLVIAGDGFSRDGTGFQDTSFLDSIELYDPVSDRFIDAGVLEVGRTMHAATLLPDGRVLIVGGYEWPLLVGQGGPTGTAEIWVPAATEGLLAEPRSAATATRLTDGRVLIVGGFGSSQTAEVWDPATGSSTPTGAPTEERTRHTATRLADGRVLVVGGAWSGPDGGAGALRSAEVWDPATGLFTPVGRMEDARSGHAATLLPDGRVLVTGGTPGSENPGLRTAEVWDPATGMFSPAGTMRVARTDHAAAQLADGGVLVVGGVGGAGNARLVERWEPGSASFVDAGRHPVALDSAQAVPLPDGRVLVVGSYIPDGAGEFLVRSSAVVVDPVRETFTDARPPRGLSPMATVTPLADGRVLFTGGMVMGVDATGASDSGFIQRPLRTAFTWDAEAGFARTGPLREGRWWHTATELADGRVLIAGGLVPGAPDDRQTVEVWDPAVGRSGPVVAVTP